MITTLLTSFMLVIAMTSFIVIGVSVMSTFLLFLSMLGIIRIAYLVSKEK